jgi:hypothetical protein
VRFAHSNVNYGFVNIVAPRPTPAPVPVPDSGIDGIEVDIASTVAPAIPNDIRGAVRRGVMLTASIEIWGNWMIGGGARAYYSNASTSASICAWTRTRA